MATSLIPTIIEYPDNVKSGCSFWRSRGVLSDLSRLGHINLIEGNWNEDWDTLRLANIAFFQRPQNKACLNQILKAKDCGLKIWIDLDDVSEIHPSHPVYKLWTETFDQKTFQKVMLCADIVTVSTSYLKDYYLRYSNNVEIVPNAINDYWLKFKKPSNNKVVLIRGGEHHLSDIYHYKDEIISVMQDHPDWKLVILGCEAKFISDKISNYEYGGDYDIHQYFGYILNRQPSIVIVPLENNDLNKGKSNISWQEATLCGASALTPHWWNLNKYSLTYKDKKTFKGNFDRLILSKDLRIELQNKSVEKIKSDLVLSKVNNKRLQIIKKLL